MIFGRSISVEGRVGSQSKSFSRCEVLWDKVSEILRTRIAAQVACDIVYVCMYWGLAMDSVHFVGSFYDVGVSC